jgi:hypothetical protein
MMVKDSVVAELEWLGEVSRQTPGDCKVKDLVGKAKTDMEPYTHWSSQQQTILLRLHKEGSLGGLEMSTVRKVLTMDPAAWAAQVVIDSQAADIRVEKLELEAQAHATQLREEKQAHAHKLKRDKNAHELMLADERSSNSKMLHHMVLDNIRNPRRPRGL